MIALLKGTVEDSGQDWVILDVMGVGYKAFCSARTLSRLPSAPQVARLHIETQMREDRIQLFGFIDQAERDWFLLLLGVQGVGGRVALSLLSVLTPELLHQSIAAQDKTPLLRADGVGAKLAARLLTELKDKATGPAAIKGHAPALPGAGLSAPLSDEAVSALQNLGYARFDAYQAVQRSLGALHKDADLSLVIKQALKELAA
jgi:Holliday junction DNA helicase RuvA